MATVTEADIAYNLYHLHEAVGLGEDFYLVFDDKFRKGNKIYPEDDERVLLKVVDTPKEFRGYWLTQLRFISKHPIQWLAVGLREVDTTYKKK